MSKRDPKLLTGDMIESAEKFMQYTSGMKYEDFINDSKTIDAVIRNFEIIGESANRLPTEFKLINPSIDWNRIRGFRNRIIHDYFGIDYSIVWLIKENFLPDFIEQIKQIQ